MRISLMIKVYFIRQLMYYDEEDTHRNGVYIKRNNVDICQQ